MSIRREAFLSILVAGALAAGLVSAPAFAGKKISPPAGCVIFPPAYVDTGNPFQVKIVKDPSYPGGWVAPLVEAAATFKVRGPGTVTVSYTGSVSRYGVTYVYATLNAPSCDGTPCFINTSVDAVITATVYEPLSDGSLRETVCAPAQVSVNPAS
jgi:hypothetical protein